MTASLQRLARAARERAVQQQRRMLLSSMAAKETTTSSTHITSTVELPVTHSIRQLPPACVDAVELNDMTEHVLTTEVGNLFQFNRSTQTLDRDDSAEAWKVADATAQMVEYLIRGHSARVPGTLWSDWTEQQAVNKDGDPLESIATMDALIGRIWDEGNFYMKVRKEHLSQMAWERDLKEQEIVDGLNMAELAQAMNNEEEDDESTWEEATSGDQDDDDDIGSMNEEDDTMEDFAMPGPTVNMYDTFLDSLAVLAADVKPQDISNPDTQELFKARTAFETLQIILYRHKLDGDDALNANIHTLPTQVSFNATIRTAANLHYDEGSELQRDWALMAAFGAHDGLTHSSLEKNPMTYTYLLNVIGKYIPPCASRGNMANGLLRMAKSEGHFDGHVLEAFVKANEPSNGPEFDQIIEEKYRGKDWRTDFSQKWRRRAKVSRLVERQRQNKY